MSSFQDKLAKIKSKESADDSLRDLKQKASAQAAEKAELSSPAKPFLSFLKEFKKTASVLTKGGRTKLKEEKREAEAKKLAPFLRAMAQLEVDVFKSPSEAIVFAKISGVVLDDLSVVLEEGNDGVVISGVCKRPENYIENKEEGKYINQECSWWPFYRQINFNAEINAFGIDARVETGVLILRLPFLKTGENRGIKKKIKINEVKN